MNVYRIDPSSLRYAHKGMKMTHLKKDDAVSTFTDRLNKDKIDFTKEEHGDEVWFYGEPRRGEPPIGKVVPVKAY
jgi:hypothetical protein